MGVWFLGAFGEKDKVLIEEIAKLHKADVETVEKFYKEMLENVKATLQNRN